MKCKKITDIQECAQWFPPGDARHDPNPLVRHHDQMRNPSDAALQLDYFVVTANDSHIQVKPGDWIVAELGFTDRAKVVDPDTFARTYQLLPEAAAS